MLLRMCHGVLGRLVLARPGRRVNLAFFLRGIMASLLGLMGPFFHYTRDGVLLLLGVF